VTFLFEEEDMILVAVLRAVDMLTAIVLGRQWWVYGVRLGDADTSSGRALALVNAANVVSACTR